MPADAYVPLLLGRGGLNLRDQPAQVRPDELVDGLNWRLDERGALVKRLGYSAYTATTLAAVPLALGVYSPASGTPQLIVQLTNGSVYRSPGDGTYTLIDSTLTAGVRAYMVQMGDRLYIANGIDVLRYWDGATMTTVGTAPLGRYLAVWRNRLWLACDPSTYPRRVWWSKIGTGEDFTTYPLNYVDLMGARGQPITAIYPSPTPGSFGNENADGILVFKRASSHRITDDSDNTGGVVSGGANVTIDNGRGTVSPRSLATLNGRAWALGVDGVYSTDGHSPMRHESGKLGTLFVSGISPVQQDNAVGVAWQGAYLLALTRTGDGANTLVLELYAQHPKDGEGNYPILAHSIPAGAWAVYPDATGDRLYFLDTSSSLYIRRFGVGGADVAAAITAYARTGAMDFGSPRQKRLRRIRVDGRGALTLSVSADFSLAAGSPASYALSTSSDVWGGGGTWDSTDTWGPAAGAISGVGWYDLRGRYLTFQIAESSTSVGSARNRFGIQGIQAGGAAVYACEVRLTPLDCE